MGSHLQGTLKQSPMEHGNKTQWYKQYDLNVNMSASYLSDVYMTIQLGKFTSRDSYHMHRNLPCVTWPDYPDIWGIG